MRYLVLISLFLEITSGHLLPRNTTKPSLSLASRIGAPLPKIITSQFSSIHPSLNVTPASLNPSSANDWTIFPSPANFSIFEVPLAKRLKDIGNNPDRSGGGVDPGDPGFGKHFGEGCTLMDCCPEPRRVLADKSYPWSTIGRIVSPLTFKPNGDIDLAEFCTGTLVGDRHVLTAGHCVTWDDGTGNVGPMMFQPLFFNGPAAPDFHVQSIYVPGGSQHSAIDSEEGAGLDFVIAVLDRHAGRGYMGAKTYNTDWNNALVWAFVGYPGDFGSANFPVVHSRVRIEDSYHPGAFGTEDGLNILTHACQTKGSSGGPYFALFDDAPYIVGVGSSEGQLPAVLSDLGERKGHWAAGGSHMVNLILQARSMWP